MDQANQDERESAARQQFIADLSHELRTPLNALVCLVQLLELEGSAELPREELQRIQAYAWQLSGMVDQLLQSLATGPCWSSDMVSDGGERKVRPMFNICRRTRFARIE